MSTNNQRKSRDNEVETVDLRHIDSILSCKSSALWYNSTIKLYSFSGRFLPRKQFQNAKIMREGTLPSLFVFGESLRRR